ncbi:MAG: Fe2+-dependent dioxygenase [Polyangiaceae bacterium]|nr:Fe2+-dependent dioxygenase [Polyangiaceae bacterium]
MLAIMKGILSPEALRTINQKLAGEDFDDGKKTAKGFAREVKHNLQLDPNRPVAQELAAQAQKIILQDRAFHALTWAKKMQPLRFCKYEVGMGYGEHLDLPTMGFGNALMRTDISMTIFLTPQSSYEGGELVFQSEYGTKSIRGDAGDAIIYPANMIHQVNPVTRGERVVAITWLESRVREPAQRKILYEMQHALNQLDGRHGASPELLTLRNSLYQLTRRWVE